VKPPAFQFYPDDFIGGTCDLSAKEVGAYIRYFAFSGRREKSQVTETNYLALLEPPLLMKCFPSFQTA